jgi:2'-5' RNA ligase
MRLFTAIDLDDPTRAALAAEQERIKGLGGIQGLRLVAPSRLHLTLVFIGEVDAARGRALIEAMGAGIEQDPFTIGFGGVGVFPAHGPPRVLWIGLREGQRQTLDLHAAVARRLEPLGVCEARGFRPHLTLGRWPRGGGRGRLRMDDRDRVVARTTVDAVVLVESRLSAAGPSYTAVATAPLRCPTAS